jgi:hypothetical protein
MIKALRYILLISIINPVWAQSPWLQEKNTLLTQISFNVIPEYHQLYLNSGKTYTTERNLKDNTLQAWIGYGFSEKTGFQLILPIKYLNAGDLVEKDTQTAQTTSGSLQAFGNIALIWKQKLLHQSWLLTSHLIAELPTAKYQDDSGLRSGYDAGSISAALSTGRGFGLIYLYAYLGIGYRSNDYSGFYTGGFEVGYQFARSISVATVINVLQSLQNGTRQDPVNNILTGLYVDNQEYIAWGLKVFGPIIPDKFGYSAAMFGAVNGNFVAKSPALNLGVYYIFSH